MSMTAIHCIICGTTGAPEHLKDALRIGDGICPACAERGKEWACRQAYLEAQAQSVAVEDREDNFPP